MKNVYLICNAHLDPVWQWDWKDGLAACISTFRSVVNLSKQYDFVFAHNESVLYAWIEEYDPELFSKIVKLVKSGKWKIMGGWYIQPDCNIPSAESFIRQIKAGNEYFLRKFGAECTTAVNFDSFGHSAALPQILKKCGYDGYMFCRPMADYSTIPDKFIWRGVDGSEVTAARVSGFYNCPMGHARRKAECELERFSGEENLVVLWGVGNHGGGPSACDIRDINALTDERKEIRFVQGVPEDYIKAVKHENLPVCEGGINPMFPGCYTSQIKIKQKHAELEYGYYITEKLAAFAAESELGEYPEKELGEACCDLLFSQFHDTLAGTCVKHAMEDSLTVMEHGVYILDKIKARCMTDIGRCFLKPQGDDITIGIFNPHPYEVHGIVKLDCMMPSNMEDGFRNMIVKMGGKTLNSQVIKEDSNIPIDWSKKIAVEYTLPAMSADCFYIGYEYMDLKPFAPANISALACGNYTVCIDEENGCIKGITAGGKQALGKAAYLALYKDNYDPWGMQHYQHERLAEYEKPFCVASPELCGEIAGAEAPLSAVKVVESGDVLTEVECVTHCGNGCAVTDYTFYKNFDYFDIHITIDNMYASKMVKLLFDVGKDDRFYGGISAGEEEIKQNGAETFFSRYVRGEKSNFAIAAKSIHGVSIKDGVLELSLMRTPLYTGHYIDERHRVLKGDRYADRVDRGQNEFSLRVYLGSGEILKKRIERLSCEITQPPVVMAVSPTGEKADCRGVKIEGDEEIVLNAMKLGKAGEVIFRLYNSSDAEKKTRVFHKGASIDVTLSKYELKTVIFQNGKMRVTEGLEI